MSLTPQITLTSEELTAVSTIPVKVESIPSYFPPEYIMPNGYYQCLISSWNVEVFEGKTKLILELFPLDHWDVSSSGKRKELFNTLEYKGRFPLQYVYDFEEFYLPRGDKLQRIHKLIQAVVGKLETNGDYTDMFNKLVGSQVIFRLIQKVTPKGRTYMIFEKGQQDILSVEDDEKLELPVDYNSKDDNSVFTKGISEGENWLHLLPREEISNLVKYSLLPNSDYIYLIPVNGAGGVDNWLDKIKPTRKNTKDQQDKFIQYNFSLMNKNGLSVFYINKVRNENYQSVYPKDLDQRVQAFKEMGLKPVSKEWLWDVIKSGSTNAYSQVENYFKENMPQLFLKKEFTK